MPADESRTPIRFGTDGWRAVVGEDYTFDNVRACAAALAAHMHDAGLAKDGAVVGYDTRFISDRFAAAVAEVLSDSGIPTHLFSRPGPTPAGSLAITMLNAGGGAIITASHNPAEWNGFKVKSNAGGSAPPEMVEAIERHLQAILTGDQGPLSGTARAAITEFDPVEPYAQRLGELVDADALRSAGLKVAVDAMHGAGAGVLPSVLAGGSTEVVEIRSAPNPAFPGMGQPEPVEANLSQLADAVRKQGADVGLALDGDADRLGVVDENGVYMSTLDVFSLITDHLIGRKQAGGGVACTITMSSMIDRLGEKYGAPVYRTPVGFKYVGPAMVDYGCAAGGEESGGYAFRGHIPERDGPLSGLMFLEAIVHTGKTPSQLLDELQQVAGPHVFRRIDLEFPAQRSVEIRDALVNAQPDSLGGLRVESEDRRDGVKYHLAGGAWAAARLSGTEPLVRLYAEAPNETTLTATLADLRALLAL